MRLNVCIIIGTRPEIMKLYPVITELKKKKIQYFVIHTGQHYSYELDEVFFRNLQLEKPDFNIKVGSKSPGNQTGLMISRIEKILQKNKPDVVLVPGDTNTTLAGAIAAKKLDIPVGHIEAGLRSFDETMPEEWNRRMVDHCCDLLFAPTKISQGFLRDENIPKNKIFVVGNTIVDAVLKNTKHAKKSKILTKLEIKPKKYFLVSIHRKENVTNPKRFKDLIKSLKLLKKEFGVPIIFPIHPRTKKAAKDYQISLEGINLINPADYFDFLQLQMNAQLVLTDSGGVQEETCILKVPCVTLRDNTERPESVKVGASVIAGTNPQNILKCAKKMIKKKRNWKNPFGDGDSGEKIVSILLKKF